MTSTREKMRTVKVNDRGQIVIPEEMRMDLQIEGDTTLVLIERGNEIILRREQDVLKEMDAFWRPLKRAALERAWSEEDVVWEEHYTGESP